MRMTLNELFPSWLDDGAFFSLIADKISFPWNVDMTPRELDTLLMVKHRSRRLSTLFNTIANRADKTEQLEKIALVFVSENMNRWEKLYNSTVLEYNPIENYNMKEKETSGGTGGRTSTDKRSDSTNRKSTDTNKSETGLFGMNSTIEVPSDVNKITTDSEGTEGSSSSGEMKETTNRTDSRDLTRSGNIGVTTTQQMIESERNVLSYKFYEEICTEVADFMCISIY